MQALLDGVAGLTFTQIQRNSGMSLRVSIVIVDNEGNEEVRRICAKFSRAEEWHLTYVHEPQRGISYARNAVLNNLPAGCDFVAMLDDDEVPAPDWLDQLLLAQAAAGADVVQGQVVPVFAPGTPTWVSTGSFFGRPRRIYSLDLPRVANLQERTCAGTNNVFVRTRAIVNLRFDPAMALSGGEDTLFFRMLADREHKIVHAATAIVYESIPRERANFRYMLMERFRIGNANVFVERRRKTDSAPVSVVLAAGLNQCRMGLRRVLKTIFGSRREKARFAVGAFQFVYGLGMLAAALGYRHQHYK